MKLVALALLPALLLLTWIDRQDAHPEPRRVVWITALLGALSAGPVVLVELRVDALLTALLADARWPSLPRALLTALVGVALPEELAKLAAVALYARRHRAFDEPMDGVVYGAAAALGFAAVENVAYVLDGGVGTALARGLLAVPGHAFDGMLMGALLGVGFVRPRARGRYTALALLLPALCHALYDAPMLLALTPFASGVAPSWATVAAGCALAPLPVVVTALQWVTVRDLVARLRRAQLAAHPGAPAGRPRIPLLGGLRAGLLRWSRDGGLRALFLLGAASAALTALLFLGLAALALCFPDALRGGLVEALAEADAPIELTRLGVDGCARALALFVGCGAAQGASLAAGFLYAARRLRR